MNVGRVGAANCIQIMHEGSCTTEGEKRIPFLESWWLCWKIVLLSISRALWFNDLPLARKLLRWSSIAKDFMYIEDCSLARENEARRNSTQVIAFSHESFEPIFLDFHNVFHRSEVNQLQNEIAATESLIVKKQFKSRLQCARRLQGVFWKTGNV